MTEEIKVRLACACPACGEVTNVEVNAAAWAAYAAGMLIQDAFPLMDADQRELLMSGTCSDCWDMMFAEYDEEFSEQGLTFPVRMV